MRYAGLIFVAIIAALFAAVPVEAQHPSVAMGATGQGITNIGNAVVPGIVAAIRAAEFPGESGKSSGYKYSVSNINMKTLKYDSLVLNMLPTGFQAGIRGLTIGLSLKWSYKKRKIPWLPRGSGSADVSLSGCTITGLFRFSRDGRKGLAVSVSDIVSKIDSVSVKTKGSLFSWLYNLIIKIFKSKIKGTIERSIVEGFKVGVNQRMAQMLGTLELIRPVSNWGVIDLSMPRDPVYYTNSRGGAWTFNFNGEVYPSNTRAPLNVVPRPSMPWTTVNRDFELNFSFFTLNSAAAVWHRMRPFVATTTNANRPAGFPVALTAQAWNPHIPNVQKSFANQPLEIKTVLSKYPTAGTNGNQMFLKAEYQMHVTSNGRPVFVLSAAGSGFMSVTVRANSIVPRIDDMTGEFKVVSSSVGQFNLKAVEFIFNAVLKLVALPALNNELLVGFPLPTINGLSFNSPSVTVRQGGYITVGLNADYRP